VVVGIGVVVVPVPAGMIVGTVTVGKPVMVGVVATDPDPVEDTEVTLGDDTEDAEDVEVTDKPETDETEIDFVSVLVDLVRVVLTVLTVPVVVVVTTVPVSVVVEDGAAAASALNAQDRITINLEVENIMATFRMGRYTMIPSLAREGEGAGWE